jgi:hypothetical protein
MNTREALQIGRRIAVVVAALVLVPAATRAMDVTEVLMRAQQATTPDASMRAKFEFVITNAKGDNVHWAGQLYRRGGSDPRVRLVFDAPLDLRGTEVAVAGSPGGGSRTRVYLPALRRVRELSADMRGESFLGTDFNYEDLGFLQLEFEQHALRSNGAAAADGDCYKLESVPASGWWYGRIVRCIDKKTYLPRRTEYYDRAGILWKLRTFDEIKKIGLYPTATEITMTTVPTATSTRIRLSDIAYDSRLPDSVFEGP